MPGHLVAASLIGNLGNQLFQYAAVKGLQADPQEPAVLDTRLRVIWGEPLNGVLQAGSFRELTSRELLGLRQTPRIHLGQRKVMKLRDCLVRETPRRMGQQGFGAPSSALDRIVWSLGAIAPRRWLSHYQFEEADAIGFDPSVRLISPPVLLRGFFQSEQYFSSRTSIVSDAFSVPGNEVVTNMRSLLAGARDPDRVVAVSFRAASDYRDVALPWGYFSRAAASVVEALGIADFVIFGDDPSAEHHVRAALAPYGPVTSLVAEPPLTQLSVMSLLPHVVISNSTFAWWGAWLGDQNQGMDRGRVVIAPDPWIGRGDGIVPDRWLRLPRERVELHDRSRP